ncbi:restriction endonuclease [Longispora albida]|uniref:restriction endonuclease n=1 Tax=Longispora albida TaxID=203523 RepID=UPI001B7FDE57|nr:restriction endonuclease [Longispora albida]
MHDVSGLRGLIGEYGRLRRLEGHTPQSRGMRFNDLLAQMLRCYGHPAQSSLRAAGEIDVAFTVGGVRYVLEAKWEQQKADTGHIAKLQKRVRQRLAGTFGVFVSMSGYSSEALADLAHGERLELLLLDSQHVEAMLAGLVVPQELMGLVHDQAAFRGEAYTPLTALLTTGGTPPGQFHSPATPLIPGTAQPVLTVPCGAQPGVAAVGGDRVLVTASTGIIDADIARQAISWAAPVPGCHGNPLPENGESLLFTRGHGAARYGGGQITVLGGGFATPAALIPGPGGTTWVLSGGTPGTDAPSITRLGDRLGTQASHPLHCVSPRSAAWAGPQTLVIAASPGAIVQDFQTGPARQIAIAGVPITGLIPAGSGAVLTTSGDGTLGFLDLVAGTCTPVMNAASGPGDTQISGTGTTIFTARSTAAEGTGQACEVIRAHLPAPGTTPAVPEPAHPRTQPAPLPAAPPSRPPATPPPAPQGQPQPPTPAGATPVTPPPDPRIPWDVRRPDRGNPEGQYAVLDAHRAYYKVIVALLTLLVALLIAMVFAPEFSTLERAGAGCLAAFFTLMIIGFAGMARSPVRVEVGTEGIQVYSRTETAWIPWTEITRIDVIRVRGHLHIVAWTPQAALFPEYDNFGGGPQYVPSLGAVTLGAVNVLKAKRHEILRVLRHYGGGKAHQGAI